jgi:hypothetical protein
VGGRGICNLSIRSFQAEIMWFSLALFAYSREKRLLASSCMSVCPRLSDGLALGGYSWCFILDTYIKICRENLECLKSVTDIWHLT